MAYWPSFQDVSEQRHDFDHLQSIVTMPSLRQSRYPSKPLLSEESSSSSASYKRKVHHIQSEREITHCGCEALCGTLPAAIRAREEANSGLGPGGKKLCAWGQVSEDGENIDGRAGLRNEYYIELAKTGVNPREWAMLPPRHALYGHQRESPCGNASDQGAQSAQMLRRRIDDDLGDASGDNAEP
ncbi:hypothetical protein EDB85DRAFT_1892421 [Lactarius pseudohatsudake]|nr:hypothetical protein EDB85DRAFT_1892421 [Lactarius pseudohatsudake]